MIGQAATWRRHYRALAATQLQPGAVDQLGELGRFAQSRRCTARDSNPEPADQETGSAVFEVVRGSPKSSGLPGRSGTDQFAEVRPRVAASLLALLLHGHQRDEAAERATA